jgi:ribose/xylose/arabinose/galactoside ABC-type transport system permease subunit
MQSYDRSWLSDVVSAVVSAGFLGVSLVTVVSATSSGLVVSLILANGSLIALLALGLTLVLRAGRLDLSVVAIAALGGLLAARLATGGQAPLTGAAVAVVVGGCAGVVNGLAGSLSRMASAGVTIGIAAFAQLVAYLVAGGNGGPIVMPGTIATNTVTAIALLLALLVTAAVVVLLTVTPVRASLDAMALDDSGPGLATVVLVAAFVCCGALAALAGVLLAAASGVAEPVTGGILLPAAIAAALIGGSSLRGGSGTGYGTLIASFAVAALLAGLTLRAATSPVQLGIVGALAVVAVIGSEARSRLFS